MGVTARSLYPVVGLAALGRTLADLGVELEAGAGVEEALRVIGEAAL
jgi:pyridoxamine--pyruvate transaminase